MFAVILELRKTMAHNEEVNSEPSLCEVGLLIRHGHEHIALVRPLHVKDYILASAPSGRIHTPA